MNGVLGFKYSDSNPSGLRRSGREELGVAGEDHGLGWFLASRGFEGNGEVGGLLGI